MSRCSVRDTTAAFGPLLARKLDADYRVIAYSGFGIVRNYAGSKAELSLPLIYSRAVPSETATAAPDVDWRPQVIVINLGTNDFSTPLHFGERWADDAALRADYRARYIDFIRELRGSQPHARIILMGGDTFYGDIETVAASTGVEAVKFGPLELTACNSHPSLRDDSALADLLALKIGQL